jgi:hypothetical protein
MANPSLNSFISPNYFNKETNVSPLYAAMLAGSTYVPPTFAGVSGAASTDPGGLFGWLIYSRTALATPAKGTTSDSYLVYTNPSDLVNDLNNLGGVTSCLLSGSTAEGGTFGFFLSNGNAITGLTNGTNFMYAITYLGYGGSLILAGSTAGLVNYETTTSNFIDVLIGQNGNTAEVRYVEETPQVIGIFASQNNGDGFTAINFDRLFSSNTLVTGTTAADRVFNVAGKNNRILITSTLKENSTYTVSTSMVSDAAGAFVRAKNNNTLYFSIAGLNNSSVLNGAVGSPVIWTNEASKNIYKKNRVNFYTNSQKEDFLGLDLVGATASTGSTYSSNDRVGPSKIRQDIETNVRNILLKYVFQTNDKTTRAAITSEISLYLFNLGQYLDTTYTQIFCDDSNNTDYSSTINVSVVVKPLISSDQYVINVSTATA